MPDSSSRWIRVIPTVVAGAKTVVFIRGRLGLAIDSSKASQLASLRWCPLYGSVGLSAANAPSGASQSASTTGPSPRTSWPISDYPRASQPASQRSCPHYGPVGLFIASDTEGPASRPLNDKGPLHGPVGLSTFSDHLGASSKLLPDRALIKSPLAYQQLPRGQPSRLSTKGFSQRATATS